MFTIIIKRGKRTVSVKADSFRISSQVSEGVEFLIINTLSGTITCDRESVVSVKKYQPYQKRKHH